MSEDDLFLINSTRTSDYKLLEHSGSIQVLDDGKFDRLTVSIPNCITPCYSLSAMPSLEDEKSGSLEQSDL